MAGGTRYLQVVSNSSGGVTDDRLSTALGDRYHVEGELGSGGMAVVYRAIDRKHDRPVALKVMRPEIAAAMGRERFLTEISIAAKLQHPHIVSLIDSGDADGMLFYVMPYVEGEIARRRHDSRLLECSWVHPRIWDPSI